MEMMGCLGAFLGSIGGAFVGIVLYPSVHRPGLSGFNDHPPEFVALVSGAIGAVLAAIAWHSAVVARSEPPSEPDMAEVEAEAKRQKIRAEIAVAEGLMAQAGKDGDEEVRSKLMQYRATLEQKLRAPPGKGR
jgi:hypothetical protein